MINGGKINKKRILLAPLDWGLGHATRCIPVIKLLVTHNIEVIIGASGATASLLQKEFPTLVILPLKGYNIKYSSAKQFFFLKMIAQLPKVIFAIKKEHNWLNEIIIRHKINGVISDNRFGLFTKKIPCVFITHQLYIQTGKSVFDELAQKINYHFINRFRECWIADTGGENNLAGKLSHPKRLPEITTKYLGILSRFKNSTAQKKCDVLILISGPEPQRSIIENILYQQAEFLEESVVFVRGMPSEVIPPAPVNKNMVVYNHLPAAELNELLNGAGTIVARCGYSTIMDLVTLNKKAILIPTPGQAEQEYLAGYLKQKKLFMTLPQENFSLQQALTDFKTMTLEDIKVPAGINEKAIIKWAENCP